MEGVTYRVSIVSRLVLGLSLVVFVWVGGGGVTGGACLRVWLGGVAEGVVWVSLVVFDRGFGWEVLCWEVAWRVSDGM